MTHTVIGIHLHNKQDELCILRRCIDTSYYYSMLEIRMNNCIPSMSKYIVRLIIDIILKVTLNNFIINLQRNRESNVYTPDLEED